MLELQTWLYFIFAFFIYLWILFSLFGHEKRVMIWHHLMPLLLSLVPLSYMVAPNRELANILFFFSSNTSTSFRTINHNNMDIEIDIPRRRLASSSVNVSRESLAHSSILSISYVNRMEAQNNDPSWADQIEKFNAS